MEHRQFKLDSRRSAAGIADGNPATAAAQLEANQAGGWMGSTVDGAGDVNGDGFADVIVGARHLATPESGEGAAFVFHGLPEPGSVALLSGIALTFLLAQRRRPLRR